MPYQKPNQRPNHGPDSRPDDQPDGVKTGPSERALQAKHLTTAAQRALAEAEARRRGYLAREKTLPKEIGGRGGLEPGRYGDWEIKGIASDF